MSDTESTASGEASQQLVLAPPRPVPAVTPDQAASSIDVPPDTAKQIAASVRAGTFEPPVPGQRLPDVGAAVVAAVERWS